MSYPAELVLKIGLKDKTKGARKDLFELQQQTRVPDLITCLSADKKDTPAVLPSLEGRGNSISDSKALLGSRVKGSESKLVGGDDLSCLKEREEAIKYEPYEGSSRGLLGLAISMNMENFHRRGK